MLPARRIRSDRTLVRMVWQYLLLLLLTMAIGSYTHYNALRNDKADLVVDMRKALTNGMDLLDIRLGEMRDTAVHFQRDQNVTDIWNIEWPFEMRSQITIRKLIQTLSIRNTTSSIVDNILLCLEQPGLIVDSGMSTTRADLFLQRYSFEDESQRQSFLEDMSLRTWFTGISRKDEQQSKYLMYSVPMIAEGSADLRGNAIFLINQKSVSDLFSLFVDGEIPLLITEAGSAEPIYWTGTEDQLPELRSLPETNIRDRWKRTGYFPISDVSWRSKLEFDAFIPMRLVYDRSAYIRRVFVVTTIAELMLGFLLISRFSYANYRPLKRILNKIQGVSSEEVPSAATAYDIIEGGISRIIQRNHLLQSELKKHDALLKASVLDRLLRGSLTDPSDLDGVRREFDSRIGYYAVALLKINPLSYETEKDDTVDIQALRLIINRLLEDTNTQDCIIHNAEQDLVAVLIGLRGKPGGKVQGDIEEYYLSVKSSLDVQYRIKISIGIGTVCRGLTEINRSFTEAQRALSYIYTSEGQESVWYKEPRSFADKLYYPLATEVRLLDALRGGDIEKANQIAESVFKDNFLDKHLSTKQVEILFDELKGTIARAILEIDLDQDMAVDESLAEIDSTPYAEAVFATFKRVFAAICDTVGRRKAIENDYTVGLIKDYIEHNFSNRDFCLARVADEFSYNENYFSQYFKRHTGRTFSSYVESVRLEYTTRLLAEGADTIDEVAAKAGFLSTSTFYRRFRKTYGRSPSSYRHRSTT